MRESRRNVDDLESNPRHGILLNLSTFNGPHPDQAISLDYEKLLCLGVVVVVSPRYTGLCPGYENLSKVLLLDEFCKASSRIRFNVEALLEFLRRNVGQLGRIEGAIKRIAEVR